MALAEACYQQDKYAATSHASRAAWLRTWMSMHDAVFAREVVRPPPFPLTPLIIDKVATLFKAAGYLSFDNYMFRAKSEHLALGICGPGAWSAELSAAMKDAIRSCNRGAGTSRQSQPLDVGRVAGLGLPDEPVVDSGPVAPADFVTAGSFFLLREIELAAARQWHVTFSVDETSVTWSLPSSKTDPRAVGVSRTWDCCCSVESLFPACPVYALLRQRARAEEFALRDGVPPGVG